MTTAKKRGGASTKGRTKGTPLAETAVKQYTPRPLRWECGACRGGGLNSPVLDQVGNITAGQSSCLECKASGHVQIQASDLPSDTSAIPLPVLTIAMLRTAWRVDRRIFALCVLLGAFMLGLSSILWPIVGGLNVGGVLWFTGLAWYIATGRILNGAVRRTVAVHRWSADGRLRDWQKWWVDDAARIDNGQKRDMYGKLVAFIDATTNPVSEYAPFLAPLPDGSLKPSDSNYRITPDRLAMSEAVGQRYKRRVQDEPNEFKQIVTQTALMAMSFGGIVAIYMAVTYVPQIMEGG